MRDDASIRSRGARRAPSAADEQRVDAVLAALAPENATSAQVPEAVLAAFAAQAGQDRRGRSGSRRRAPRVGRAAPIKAAVVVLALSSGTMAAAVADVLPAPAQRAAHSLFGSWGVPAPHSHGSGSDSPSSPTPGASVTGSPGGGSARASSAGPEATSSAGGSCTGTNTHGADAAHCAASAAAGDAASPAGSAHASRGAGHGHTPTPHGSASH